MTAPVSRAMHVDSETGLLEAAFKAGKSTFATDVTLADLIATEDPAATADETAIEDLFAASEALGAYFEANEDVKELERTKRRAKKLIKTLKAGVYGGWRLNWKPTARETPDLEQIRATYKRLGLGDVPMIPCADSIEVTKA